jgi:hypothetical protein
MTPLRQALETLSDTSRRLSQVSERTFQNPYEMVEWPAALDATSAWFSSPELLSLHGTPYWERLGEQGRRQLAFWEAANFYSLNIHGEKSLMTGLAARLYRPDLLQVTEYLHHFLDEENKHSVYFGGFCTRYAKVYRSRHVPVEDRQPRDIGDFLFFAKTMVFEEIADQYNQRQGQDDRLHPLARFVNDNHHREETRHLVFGRELVAELWQSAQWDSRTRTDLGDQLTAFLVASWREYYNPDVYADMGLADPWQVAEGAWDSPAQREHRRRLSARCLDFLIRNGIVSEEISGAL